MMSYSFENTLLKSLEWVGVLYKNLIAYPIDEEQLIPFSETDVSKCYYLLERLKRINEPDIEYNFKILFTLAVYILSFRHELETMMTNEFKAELQIFQSLESRILSRKIILDYIYNN